MATDQIDYRILGDDLQAVVVTLDPGEAVVAEAGSMMYMDPDIEMETGLNTGTQPQGLLGGLLSGAKRMLAGDSFFVTLFHNRGRARSDVGFSSPFPGKIVPVELGEVGGTLICQKDSFLCGARGINVTISFQRKLGVGFFGGEGFIMQKLTSDDGRGVVLVHACGTILERTLSPGEALRVDTGCIVAFEQTVQFDVQFVKGIRNKLFGGEGLFFAVLTGPGRVWLQTLPFSRLAGRIYAAAPQGGGKQVGEGSVLGGIFRGVSGD